VRGRYDSEATFIRGIRKSMMAAIRSIGVGLNPGQTARSG